MINLNVNELRLGNYVGIAEFMNFKIAKVSSIRSERILVEGKVGIYSSNNHNIIPIELTDELILKLGFKKDKSNFKGENIFVKGSFFITESRMFFLIVGWDSMEFLNYSGYEINDGDNKIDSVHKLQNLYFALCGEELVFSTEP